MKILFVTQYFHPETEVGGIRIAEIARYLRFRGHELTIVTGLPNYPTGRLQPDYRRRAWRGSFTEVIDGLRVARVPLYPSHSKRSAPRLANYFSFATTASIRSLVMGGFDVVVATSPPLTTGVPALLTSILRRVPFVLEVRDLWPAGAVELGYLTHPKVRATAYGLERLLYRRASRIVCVSRGIRDDIVARGVQREKCVVLTNGIDIDLFKPDARDTAIEQLRAKGTTTVGIYVGSLSAYHGLEHALDLLEQLQRFPHIKIVFSGDGSSESDFRAAIEARRLTNAVLLGAVPRKRMPGLIASADFCLAFVKESAFSRWLLSSKIFMYMACGRPIYAAASGETSRIIGDARAGFVVAPTSDGIRKLAVQIGTVHDRTLNEWGQNGRAYALRRCAWHMIAADYERVLAEATGRLYVSQAPAPSEMSA